MKNLVYLQCQISSHADKVSAMQSVTGIFNACIVAYIPAVYQPRETPVMGFSSACKGFDNGKWRTAFLVPQSQNLAQS